MGTAILISVVCLVLSSVGLMYSIPAGDKGVSEVKERAIGILCVCVWVSAAAFGTLVLASAMILLTKLFTFGVSIWHQL